MTKKKKSVRIGKSCVACVYGTVPNPDGRIKCSHPFPTTKQIDGKWYCYSHEWGRI